MRIPSGAPSDGYLTSDHAGPENHLNDVSARTLATGRRQIVGPSWPRTPASSTSVQLEDAIGVFAFSEGVLHSLGGSGGHLG